MKCKDGTITVNPIWKTAFLDAVIVGVIAHGYMLFNKISYHDDTIFLFSFGGTYSSGRWVLGIVENILDKTVGLYSTPVFTGSISIILIGMSAALACDVLRIRSKLGAAYIGAIMASFPVVAGIFAYMFTAGMYIAALFLSVLGVYVLSDRYNFKRCLVACLMAISTGIYQAFLASSASLMIMALFIYGLDHPDRKFQAFYFVMNKICLMWKDVELTSYQGINGHYDILKLPAKIVDVYHSFLGGGYEEINGQYLLSHSVKVVIILTLVGALLMIGNKQLNKLCKMWLLFLLMIFPLAVYLVKLFSTDENFHVYTLMVYSLVYVYIFPICIIERTDCTAERVVLRFGRYILAAVLSMLMLIYVYYDNVAYLKMNFVQEQTIAYFTTLVTQIRSVDGYKDEYPVVLLGYQAIEDNNFFSSENFSRIKFAGYEFEQKDLVNHYANILYLYHHLGFEPKIIYGDAQDYWESEEVQNMNCYPDSGSIKIIDEAVVVKFAEFE